MNSTLDWSRYDDVAGQLPSLQGYVQLCLFFPLDTTEENKRDVTALMHASAVKLSLLCPWISGQVLNEGRTPNNSGVFKIRPYREAGTGFDIIVKVHEKLTFQAFIDKRVPMSMLDGQEISPGRDLTAPYDLSSNPIPVLVLQINYMHGGAILTFAGAHNALDGTGLGRIVDLFGRLCHGGIIKEGEIEWANRHRKSLTTLQQSDDDTQYRQMLTIDSDSKNEAKPPKTTQSRASVATTWAYIHFSGDKLAQMKKLASQGLHPSLSETPTGTKDQSASNNRPKWISTDDALSAFLWQRIAASRASRYTGSSPDASKTILCRAVNARPQLQLTGSSFYLGHMVTCTRTSIPLQALRTQPLAAVASKLRKSLTEENEHTLRSYLSFIDSYKDKSLISFTTRMDFSRDVLFSSWAGMNTYSVDFGPLLQFPCCIRRPRWSSAEGFVYLMPKARDQSIDAAICLHNEDWEVLREDETLEEFGEYIG
ncbi:hypothetical protein BT63DRAFT_430349 [Microthyrium microscopicum]|uniref:Trichothecene 3-O-acetyltransferase-like N-terminal domain-containing protein n=1 Tax=Microthyrium microscopicum TaxID=703497 RepID=A0A6A6TVZ1_9PEZI|nr:hypothetical protein BT63DRAFT_430349 [Microthyrium microscopicum]